MEEEGNTQHYHNLRKKLRRNAQQSKPMSLKAKSYGDVSFKLNEELNEEYDSTKYLHSHNLDSKP